MLYWNEIINDLAKNTYKTRKNAWEKNLHFPFKLLRKLRVHYANGFDTA
jgi:hypothetical protein